jgi:hypothetical protein
MLGREKRIIGVGGDGHGKMGGGVIKRGRG